MPMMNSNMSPSAVWNRNRKLEVFLWTLIRLDMVSINLARELYFKMEEQEDDYGPR